MRDFLKKLQTSDERTKRRWLIGSSAVMVLVVVILWLRYFSVLVQPAGVPSDPENTMQGFTFWQTFAAGFRVILHGAAETIKNWFGGLDAGKNYIIKP